jgi:hypothetical protein
MQGKLFMSMGDMLRAADEVDHFFEYIDHIIKPEEDREAVTFRELDRLLAHLDVNPDKSLRGLKPIISAWLDSETENPPL